MRRSSLLVCATLSLLLSLLFVSTAAATTPTIGSFSPSSNTPLWVSSQPQTFIVKCSDGAGVFHLSWVEVLFSDVLFGMGDVDNPAMWGTTRGLRVRYVDTLRLNAAKIPYHQPVIKLQQDDGSYIAGLPGAAKTLGSTWGSVNLAESSVVADVATRTATVTLSIVFKKPGVMPAYARACDDTSNVSKLRRRGCVTAQDVKSPYPHPVIPSPLGGTVKVPYFTYKGQLHCRSTKSGGQQSRAGVLAAYKALGYQFVAIQDWDYVGSAAEQAAAVDGVLRIPSEEDTPSSNKQHLGAVGLPGLTGPNANDLSSQERIDWVNGRGGYAILNHPCDSSHGWTDSTALSLKRLTGIAFYDSTQSVEANAKALNLWDRLSQRDGASRPWGVAVDDCNDCVLGNANFNRAWVKVRSRKMPSRWLTTANAAALRKDLLENLDGGDFFSVVRDPEGTGGAYDSAYGGPSLSIRLTTNGTEPVVKADLDGGCQKITFYEAPGLCPTWRIVKTEYNTASSTYQLRHTTRFIRVVAEQTYPVTGGQLYRVYSQPIAVTPYYEGTPANAIESFVSAPPVSPGIWPNITKLSVTHDLTVVTTPTAEKPDPAVNIDQDGQNLCGPAAILYELAKRQPLRYVEAIRSLYDGGAFRAGAGIVRPDSQLYAYAVPSEISAADWIGMASMRDSKNSVFDYDPGDDFAGITWPGDMKGWAKSILGFQTADYDSTYVYGEFSALKKARDWYNAGGVAFLLVDSWLVGSGEPFVCIPNHWIAYAGGLVLANGRVKFKAYTWGQVKQVDVSNSQFEDCMWGVVVAK
jgi:hypothetical protein